MSNRLFLCLLTTILAIAIVTRLIPLLGNNFYFTMDQGRDATYVREILQRGRIFLNGPETGIKGLYQGPLWYYFTAIGYLLSFGHPVGGILMLAILNICLTVIIIFQTAKYTSRYNALLMGLALQFFWPFYDTSRYAFNPFPMVFLSITTILCLAATITAKEKKYYVFAGIPVGLAFSSEIAFAIPLAILYFFTGLVLVFRKIVDLKTLLYGTTMSSLFLLPTFISEIQSNFSQFKILLAESSGTNGIIFKNGILQVFESYVDSVSSALIPQSKPISLVFIIAVVFIALKEKAVTKNTWFKYLLFLSLGLVSLSFLWFSVNKGIQSWHIVSIPIVIYVVLILSITQFSWIMRSIFLVILFSSQLIFFTVRYKEYLTPSNDPSLLINELSAIDWVYKSAGGNGFEVYTYLPSVLDYPYQYLIWWYGLKTYHYLPCEYSSFPDAPSLFVPGKKYYLKPAHQCSDFRLLIVEPDKNELLRNQWLEKLRANSKLIDSNKFGSIDVEKRGF